MQAMETGRSVSELLVALSSLRRGSRPMAAGRLSRRLAETSSSTSLER